jgi:benzil reductase ((S)-benzoin forming)
MNRLAVVTGTTSGIGQALAERLVDRDWTVLGLARRPSVLSHPAYTHYRVDLGDFHAVEDALERIIAPCLAERSWDRIGLVNNAAIVGGLGPVTASEPAVMHRMYAVNTVTPIWLMGWITRQVAPTVVLRIVNVSSGAAVHPFPGLGGYCGNKAALRMAGMVWAEEVQSSQMPGGPRADAALFSYEPGVVDTAMQVEARSTPGDVFPWVGVFKAFQQQGMLIAPSETVGPMVEFLEGAAAARFVERRYQA